MKNLITDVAGIRVGNAHDERLATGVTVAVFDTPAAASISIHGGAPGVRDTALLEPEATVEGVDAIFLSGGSAFGLAAGDGAMDCLRQRDRGFRIAGACVPIVPGAVVFDLAYAALDPWPETPPWRDLGFAATASATKEFLLGTAGAGYGATTANAKGGLGSASATTADGFTVGALVAVNALGSVLVGDGPYFWAASEERDGEFGGLGSPARISESDHAARLKGHADIRANTTIALVATDAVLTKSQARRIAVMAHDGIARAVRPAHAPLDGDCVFAAATGAAGRTPDWRALTLLGDAAGRCLARAIARGVYEAVSLPGRSAMPSYRDRFEA